MPARTVLPATASGSCHAEVTDDLHDHDAEGKACQRVHGVVALEEAGEERLRGVSALGYDVAPTAAPGRSMATMTRMPRNSRKQGLSTLPTQTRILPGRSEKNSAAAKKASGERQQAEPRIAALRQHLLQSHGEGGGGAAGDGEERPDGQVEQAGEKHGVGLAHAAAELKEPAGAADAERRYAEQRQSDAGYAEAYDRGPYVCCRPSDPCERGR